jgi:hypothetical protein
LECCVDWAFAQRHEAKHKPTGKGTNKGKGEGKSKGKGEGKSNKGTGKGADASSLGKTEEQLKVLRTQRLEAMQSGVLPVEPKPKLSASEEIGKLFTVEKDSGAANVVLDEQMVDSTTVLSTHAKEVTDSLQAEKFPSTRELLGAEETLSRLLLSVASCASVEAMEAAEANLAATTRSLANMVDLPKDDPDVMVWQKRKARQEEEVARLGNKAPTVSLRKLALIGAKDTYVTSLQADVDFASKGREKATKRAQLRRCTLADMAELIAELQEVHEVQTASLLDLHDERAANKASLGIDVQDLISEKITLLDNQMSTEADSDAEFCDASEQPTSAESELEEWKRKYHLALSNSSNALNAAAAESVVKAEAETAAAMATASAAVSAKDLMEIRLAKLEQMFLGAQAAPTTPLAVALPAASGSDPRSDLWLEFKAEPSDLPTSRSTPTDQEKLALLQLSGLFAAVPWGTSLPALQFDSIGAPPSFVHSIVGDTIWSACWLHRSNNISGEHWIPYKLLNILMTTVQQDKLQLDASQLEAGVKRYAEFKDAADTAAAKRRHGPYGR